MGAHLWGESLPPRGVCRVRSLSLSRVGSRQDPGGAGQRPRGPQGPSPRASGAGSTRDAKPRDSLSSSANDTPRAPVVRHRLAALPPARFTALSPRSDLGRPGPLSPVARDAGFGEGSELTQESKAPHWHPPRCGRRRRLGLRPPEGGGGACPRVTPRRRKGGSPATGGGCDSPARAGPPQVRRLLKEEGGRFPHEYRMGVRRKERGAPCQHEPGTQTL